jgi:hypothetical protein
MKQVFILLLAFNSTLQSCSEKSDKPTNNINFEGSSLLTPIKYSNEEKNKIIDEIKKVTVHFSSENNVSDLEDAKFQLRSLGLAWYECYGQLIEAKADSTIWRMKDSAVKVLSNYQKKMFPKYRKAFTEDSNKKLWIEDCSVFISGDYYDEYNLVGLAFAPNRFKQESYETLLNVLKLYRFKKLTFRTFNSSDNITSYDIKSDDDTNYISLTGD